MEETERERLLGALGESEERYRRVFEDAILGIVQSTPSGRCLAVNPAFAKMCGYESPEEMVAEVSDITRDVYADTADRERIYQLLASEGMVKGFETRLTRRNGSAIRVSINSRRALNLAGNVTYYESMVEDISERIQAKEDAQGEMRELNDLYLASQAFLGLTDIELLHEEICRLMVDQFGLRMAWIGLLEEGS